MQTDKALEHFKAEAAKKREAYEADRRAKSKAVQDFYRDLYGKGIVK